MTQKKKKLEEMSIEEVIRKTSHIPHDTVIESVIVDKNNLRKKDVNRIIDIIVKHYEEEEKKKVTEVQLKETKKWVKKRISSGFNFILLRDKKKNETIGCIHTSSTTPYGEKEKIGIIEYTYIYPEHRRKGMGKRQHRKGIYHLMKKESVKDIAGTPASPAAKGLANFRERLLKRAKKGEFKDTLKRWKPSEKAKKKRRK